MKSQLQFIRKNIFFRTVFYKILFLFCFAFLAGRTQAQETCVVNFSWEADLSNPLLIHFCGGGQFAHGSFSYTCLWDFGDGGTSTDSCPNYTYAHPGTYFVCQHASMCVGGGLSCHDSICKYVSVGQATAIEEGIKDNTLEVKYIFASKSLDIKINQDVQFRLTDSVGRIVKQIKLNEGTESIDLRNLTSGLYFYSATQISGRQVGSGKIIVN